MTDRPASRRPSLLGRTVAVAGVVASLAVAAAVVGEAVEHEAGAPVTVPWDALVLGVDALTGLFLGAGALLVALCVWALATAQRRAPREGRPWWHTPVALAVLAVATLFLSWLMATGRLGADWEQFVENGAMEAAVPLDPVGGPAVDEAGPDAGLRQGAALAGVLVALLGGAAGLWWWLRGPGQDPETGDEQDRRAAEHLAVAVEAALGDLDTETDPRRAILRCYVHLDAALARAGCARRPAETAREHRRRAAAVLGPAAQAAARLVDRFERARYDTTPVTEADRRQAVTALDEVRDILDGGRDVGRQVVGERA